jgi:hypothetical protein
MKGASVAGSFELMNSSNALAGIVRCTSILTVLALAIRIEDRIVS